MEPARGLDPWRWPNGSQPLGTRMYCDWLVLLFMTATAQVTDTVEETFSFGSDVVSDEDTTPSDNNNCCFNSDRWKGVGGFLNRHILVKEE